MAQYEVRPIRDPKGRTLQRPWGVWERMPIGGWALRSKHTSKADADAAKAEKDHQPCRTS